ncbi:hypothetical protein SAMN04487948_101440 [Halogranum amylolyticum]|uniref:HIT zinc finger n=1 Tax=Halogranum amylolyticum TaxID=660520 RepID=A0A1H8NBM7_9EURY|nr:hypothetical protein [Halogranum amylolyticum]SEO26995.1 hypothetical protein SAMN04487948_101440 [Halogranum amylolyticum]
MSLSGLCQVCESTTAEHACDQCGTQVCEEHFDRTQGVCVRCASVRDEGGVGEREKPSGTGHDDTGPGTGMR